MDGFRVVKLNEVIRQVDVVITCTGKPCENYTSGTARAQVNLNMVPLGYQFKVQPEENCMKF